MFYIYIWSFVTSLGFCSCFSCFIYIYGRLLTSLGFCSCFLCLYGRLLDC